MFSNKWIFQDNKNDITKIVKNTTSYGVLEWEQNYNSTPFFVDFYHPHYIYKYQMKTDINNRFMKGWNVTGINIFGENVLLDTKNENFCNVTTINEGRTDCGEDTIRTFSLKKGSYSKILIQMTVNDSVGTWRMNIIGLDFYGHSSIPTIYKSKYSLKFILKFTTILLTNGNKY